MVPVTVIGEENSHGLSCLSTGLFGERSSLRPMVEAGWLVAIPEELMKVA